MPEIDAAPGILVDDDPEEEWNRPHSRHRHSDGDRASRSRSRRNKDLNSYEKMKEDNKTLEQEMGKRRHRNRVSAYRSLGRLKLSNSPWKREIGLSTNRA